MKRQLIFGNILTLLLGGLIYVLFRTSSLRMFSWYEIIGLGGPISELRNQTFQFADKIPEWMLYSLPDGLWIFSYISLILFIWRNSLSLKNLFWIFIIPVSAMCSEIGQFFGLVSGTFDISDLLLYFFGMTLPFLFNYKSINLKIQFK